MIRKLLTLSFFSLLFSGQPSMEGTAQRQENRSKYDIGKTTKDRLFDIAFSNQDTLTELLIRKRKPKIRIIEKPVIKYVKMYKVIPIYIPIGDSVVYRKSFGDTLQGKYYFDEEPQKKEGWLYRLFHKKDKKKQTIPIQE